MYDRFNHSSKLLFTDFPPEKQAQNEFTIDLGKNKFGLEVINYYKLSDADRSAFLIHH